MIIYSTDYTNNLSTKMDDFVFYTLDIILQRKINIYYRIENKFSTIYRESVRARHPRIAENVIRAIEIES
jgi:hypothetical protein